MLAGIVIQLGAFVIRLSMHMHFLKLRGLRVSSYKGLTPVMPCAAVMTFYVLYMVIWAFKARREIETQGRRFQLMLLALFLSSVGIIVRGVSRWSPECVSHVLQRSEDLLLPAVLPNPGACAGL